MTKVLSAKTRYLEQKIREDYTSADVALWQGLCRQCETEVGDSIDHMYVILDMAKHNEVNVLDIIKCGRVASGQKAVNGRFMECLITEMYGDDADDGAQESKSVLDLTADEELSGSYEETDEKYIDDPNSNEAYEIDGFVVEDHASESQTDSQLPMSKDAAARVEYYKKTDISLPPGKRVSAVPPATLSTKRKLTPIKE